MKRGMTPTDDAFPITCPFCLRSATDTPEQPVTCDSRECQCGAVALGAAPDAIDKILEDAGRLFGLDDMPGTDAERVGRLRSGGIDIREGALMSPHADSPELRRYFWFRAARR